MPSETAPQPTGPALTSNADLAAMLGRYAAEAAPGGLGMARGGATWSLIELGLSGSGAPLWALRVAGPAAIASSAALAAPASAPTPGNTTASVPPKRPSVLLIGQQHGDEPAGAQALLKLAEQLSQGRMADVLRRVDVLLVPRLNVDGAARGQRGNAAGIDIDADHLLLRTPEARALASLIRDEDPAVIVDLREYDPDPPVWRGLGATPAADVLLDTAASTAQSPYIGRAADEWFRGPLARALAGAGLKTDDYYVATTDPAGRPLARSSVQPDTTRNVTGLRNAVSLIVATRGSSRDLTDLPARVQAQLIAAASVLASAAARADDLVKLRQFVGREVASQACRGEVVLDAEPTRVQRTLDMLDARTGQPRKLSVDGVTARELELRRTLPRPCGYWLSARARDAAETLRLLGVDLQTLTQPTSLLGSTYREVLREPPAGNGPVLPAGLDAMVVDMPAGSYYLSLAQPLANLAVAALEPGTPYGDFAHRMIGGLDQIARLRALLPAAPGLPPVPAPLPMSAPASPPASAPAAPSPSASTSSPAAPTAPR